VGGPPLSLWEVDHECQKPCGQGLLRTPTTARPTEPTDQPTNQPRGVLNTALTSQNSAEEGAGGRFARSSDEKAKIDDGLVDQVKSELTPDVALLLIGASGDADQMTRAFEAHHPTSVIRRPLSDETVEHLKRAVGDDVAKPPRPD
jgi:hypothetical protein